MRKWFLCLFEAFEKFPIVFPVKVHFHMGFKNVNFNHSYGLKLSLNNMNKAPQNVFQLPRISSANYFHVTIEKPLNLNLFAITKTFSIFHSNFIS